MYLMLFLSGGAAIARLLLPRFKPVLRVYLGLSDGAVELLEVKPDGKRSMAASAWAAGLQGADLTWGVLS